MKKRRSCVSAVMLAIIMLSSAVAFGAMKGDIDNSGKIELQDAVLGLQVTAGLRNATDGGRLFVFFRCPNQDVRIFKD